MAFEPVNISPKEFGLPARTILQQIEVNIIAIVVDRKSRIIMADGRKILEKAKKIQELQPSMSIALKTTAPVCSKTKQFLQSTGIELMSYQK